MASLAERIKKYLDRIEKLFRDGKRSGRVLTLLAVARLSTRGEPLTPKTVAEEARRIIAEHPETDWGVKAEDVTVEFVSEILRELAKAGVLEEIEGGYRVKRTDLIDPAAEIMARFGHLLLYGGPAR
ncbi:MAG: hypothetical protein F7C34_01835 [Desulfurococcales archaeon]|nr:hypothetical protein [Desulfurococcales archaeon]